MCFLYIKSINVNVFDEEARDFYDLYVLFNGRKDEIRKDVLITAVEHTMLKRGSLEKLDRFKEICDEIKAEAALQKLWKNYVEDNLYAEHLTYEDVVENVLAVGKFIKTDY